MAGRGRSQQAVDLPVSLAGRARIKGSTVTTKRATRVVAANKTSRASWADVAVGLQVKLGESTRNLEQKHFGRELEANYIARPPIGTDVLPGDGWVITVGKFAGTRLIVLDAIRPEKHVLVALKKTDEPLVA
jgi:hypothetical protein